MGGSRHSPAGGLLRSRSWEHLPCSLPDPLVAPLMARPLLWMAAGRPNNMRRQGPSSIPRVVVIGAGFGGLAAVRALRRADVEVILIDKRNHHLFQPLLYQVATAALSPADIAAPIRTVLRRPSNVRVILHEAIGLDRKRGV